MYKYFNLYSVLTAAVLLTAVLTDYIVFLFRDRVTRSFARRYSGFVFFPVCVTRIFRTHSARPPTGDAVVDLTGEERGKIFYYTQ